MHRLLILLVMVLFVSMGCAVAVRPPAIEVGVPAPVVEEPPFYDGPYTDVPGYIGTPLFFYDGRFFSGGPGAYIFIAPCPPGRLEFYRGRWNNGYRGHYGHEFRGRSPERGGHNEIRHEQPRRMAPKEVPVRKAPVRKAPVKKAPVHEKN